MLQTHGPELLSIFVVFLVGRVHNMIIIANAQWLKWSREAGGGAHLTKPGWSKPHTHSTRNNFALFGHKIDSIIDSIRGLILLQRAQIGAGG